uniref:Uncharacterized protein n=1 Tax=Myotis myotis TaxID=51298 RepID=A0A7J7R1A4_MYOMY|nr:hypothetical protein mMyoMyo1_011216 [Myotis myotis]
MLPRAPQPPGPHTRLAGRDPLEAPRRGRPRGVTEQSPLRLVSRDEGPSRHLETRAAADTPILSESDGVGVCVATVKIRHPPPRTIENAPGRETRAGDRGENKSKAVARREGTFAPGSGDSAPGQERGRER